MHCCDGSTDFIICVEAEAQFFESQDNRGSDALKNSLADLQLPAVVAATPSIPLNLFICLFTFLAEPQIMD